MTHHYISTSELGQIAQRCLLLSVDQNDQYYILANDLLSIIMYHGLSKAEEIYQTNKTLIIELYNKLLLEDTIVFI